MYALFKVTSDWYSFSNLLAVSEDFEKLQELGSMSPYPLIEEEEVEDQGNDHDTYFVVRKVLHIKGVAHDLQD
tara:strand:- start:5566 stop:5784 length:219 start_codon:yes stop_codon:yes gene_type:complete